jgi:hypothetical protein
MGRSRLRDHGTVFSSQFPTEATCRPSPEATGTAASRPAAWPRAGEGPWERTGGRTVPKRV